LDIYLHLQKTKNEGNFNEVDRYNARQVDTYLVDRTTGLDEEVVEGLSEDIEKKV
jgi:hypothetical protein